MKGYVAKTVTLRGGANSSKKIYIKKVYKMKKIMMSLAAVAMMATSALALDGTVGDITVRDTGVINVSIIKADLSTQGLNLVGTAEAQKSMLAVCLTAKSTGASVSAYGGVSSVSGENGWKIVVLK